MQGIDTYHSPIPLLVSTYSVLHTILRTHFRMILNSFLQCHPIVASIFCKAVEIS